MARTPAQIGKANRRNGRDAERKVRDWLRPRGWPELDYTHAGGPTRAHADDRGDLAPCIDRDGDHWTIQVKGPRSQPSPGEVERWAAETAAQADANGRAAPTRPALTSRPGPEVTVASMPCLDCGALARHGNRCPACARRHRGHYRAGWTTRSRLARAQHIAAHGPVCPGFNRPPHRVDPDRLQLDHTTGRVLCNLCNVHAGPAPGRGARNL